MSDFSIPSGETDFSAPTLGIPGQKITFAGEGLQDDRFLFGTDNGLVLECGVHGSLENMNAIQIGKDDESINAIPFYYDEHVLHLAATTRTDIILNSFFVNPIKRQRWHAEFRCAWNQAHAWRLFCSPCRFIRHRCVDARRGRSNRRAEHRTR